MQEELIITDEHKIILSCMNDEYVYFYWHLVKNTGIELPKLKKLMIELRNAGFVFLTSVWDENDGMIAGRGWMTTDKGDELKNLFM